jgi:hypothetical protein
METDRSKSNGGIFGRLRNKISGREEKRAATAGQNIHDSEQLMKEFEAVKESPGHLTGRDFDRAFDFIERYPDSEQAEILMGQMYATTGQLLKGLSYTSAVKVLERMPGHAGAESITRGMYQLEEDYIQELRSEIIAYMLLFLPDHPLAAQLTTALARKNLTSAYDFVTGNPDNIYARDIIRAMFDRDANIALLLLQESLDHPQVDSIFEGIYTITRDQDIDRLTPNAIIFVLEVAPDHPRATKMIEVLVKSNYVKAYDFAKMSPEHALYGDLRRVILKRKPELEKLFVKEEG